MRYVSANLPGRTTVLVTAEQTAAIGFYIALARTLRPSIVVLEGVDLVGRSRENVYSPKAERLLNRLLNDMDGLEPNADILFLLTTNRPEDIEDPLASRPGASTKLLRSRFPTPVAASG
ncbi:AAA family ATPase [Mesorhizobium onobrychidis]|uniref:AAA family ATPase n=1 Tax=Mesorhizobium onobrychidis TaxID=2775404 RepID=UPI002867D849|nr:AAA family ATPase [Mesorhizobium onobrychidis]